MKRSPFSSLFLCLPFGVALLAAAEKWQAPRRVDPEPSSRGYIRLHHNISHLSLTDYVSIADAIVVARIQGSGPVLLDDGLVYTQFKASVMATYKGDVPSEIALIVPGGSLAGRVVVAAASPSPREGDECLMFLTAVSRDRWGILGLSDGLYSLAQGDGSGFSVHGLHAPEGTTLQTMEEDIYERMR